jgi:hypothetical protein
MAVPMSGSTGQAMDARGVLTAISLCTIYIVISAVLINFNKFMMHKERFPFAMMLTTCHMTISWLFGLTLYAVRPSLFPSMEMARVNKGKILRYFVPLAGLFAIGVVLSNQAYMYCSVAFLQFMKQANVSLVFCLSCIVGSQVLDRMKLLVIAWIICGSALAVEGALTFVLIGFLIQLGSQLGECSKNVLQEWILSGSDIRLDPLSYNLFMCPVCLVVLGVGNLFTWDSQIIPRMAVWWPYLIPNAACAFALNVTIAVLIKNTSAMAFILAGVVKDMVIVVGSTYVFGEQLVPQQVLGFSIASSGIFFWSYMKLAPKSTVVQTFAKVLNMPQVETEGPMTKEEIAPLIEKSQKV